MIFSTRIGQTAITINNLKVVIDCGYDISFQYNREFQSSQPIVKKITQSASLQRRGRIGRTSVGDYFPLYSKADFEKMEAYDIGILKKMYLGSVILWILRFRKNYFTLNFLRSIKEKFKQNLVQIFKKYKIESQEALSRIFSEITEKKIFEELLEDRSESDSSLKKEVLASFDDMLESRKILDELLIKHNKHEPTPNSTLEDKISHQKFLLEEDLALFKRDLKDITIKLKLNKAGKNEEFLNYFEKITQELDSFGLNLMKFKFLDTADSVVRNNFLKDSWNLMQLEFLKKLENFEGGYTKAEKVLNNLQILPLGVLATEVNIAPTLLKAIYEGLRLNCISDVLKSISLLQNDWKLFSQSDKDVNSQKAVWDKEMGGDFVVFKKIFEKMEEKIIKVLDDWAEENGFKSEELDKLWEKHEDFILIEEEIMDRLKSTNPEYQNLLPSYNELLKDCIGKFASKQNLNKTALINSIKDYKYLLQKAREIKRRCDFTSDEPGKSFLRAIYRAFYLNLAVKQGINKKCKLIRLQKEKKEHELIAKENSRLFGQEFDIVVCHEFDEKKDKHSTNLILRANCFSKVDEKWIDSDTLELITSIKASKEESVLSRNKSSNYMISKQSSGPITRNNNFQRNQNSDGSAMQGSKESDKILRSNFLSKKD